LRVVTIRRGRLSLSAKPAAIPAAATINGSAAIPTAATIDRATTVPIPAAIDGSTTIPIPAAIDCATTIPITAPVVGTAIAIPIVGTGRIVDAGTVVSITIGGVSITVAIGGVPITVAIGRVAITIGRVAVAIGGTGAGSQGGSCRQADDSSSQDGSAATVSIATAIVISRLGLVGGGNGAEAEHGCRSEDAKLLHDSDLMAKIKTDSITWNLNGFRTIELARDSEQPRSR
jgi:hypothetical protein